jgi:GNAT superfamily N-acetyltransferase
MSLTSAGKTSTPTTSTTSKPKILIRPARFRDAFRIGEISATTYYDTPLFNYLTPYARTNYGAFMTGNKLRSFNRMLNPRNLAFVAVEETNPDLAIGYAIFTRLGDDEGAKRQIASRKTWWLTLLAWMWSYIMPLIVKLYTGKADSPENLAEFNRIAEVEEKKYFGNYPERANRWYAQSVVVSKPFQGRKIGKAFMAEVIKRAQAEGVCVSLESSPKGEMLYRSVGFELISPFMPLQGWEGVEQEGGGIMIWKPEGWKYN